MYVFSDDVLDVLVAFEAAGVRYILVGGMAMDVQDVIAVDESWRKRNHPAKDKAES